MINRRSLTSFTPREIRALFKEARTVLSSPFFVIRKAPAHQETGRLLIVIPRRVGNAVQRNKLRRRLREIFYTEEGYAKKSDFVFFAKAPEVAQKSFEELQEIMKKALA